MKKNKSALKMSTRSKETIVESSKIHAFGVPKREERKRPKKYLNRYWQIIFSKIDEQR